MSESLTYIDLASSSIIYALLLSECCCRSPHIINQLFTSSLLMFNEWGCCGQLLMNCGHGEKAQRIGQIRYYTDCVCVCIHIPENTHCLHWYLYQCIFVIYTITILKLTVIKGHYLFCILFVLFLFIPLCVCLFIYRLLGFFFLYWFLWLYIFFTIWFIWVFF